MKRTLLVGVLALGLSACESMPVKMGSQSAKSPATGSAAGSQTENVNPQLERCDQTLGTMSVIEDRYASWYHYMSRYGVQSTVPVLRLLAQQSNCFVVVERGQGLSQAMQERRMESSGELREGSNFGKGQMVAADYSVTPTLVFKDRNSGGIGAAVGGLLGTVGSVIGGSLNFKSAQSILTLVDNRSTVQVAVAEGSAKGTDLGGFLGGLHSSVGGALGGYTKTAEGKVIVGAMMDAYNNLVRAVRNYQPQAPSGPGGHGTGGKLKVN